MTDLAIGISLLFVKPEGSNRVWLNLSTKALSGTPYCKEIEVIVAIVSMRPETVLPSFAIFRKISPGVPSS